jgi:succinate dehydrogenase / fumarate reductase membrane anchor subunit
MRNTYLQFVQLVSGALIAVLLGIHVVFMHLDKILGFFGIGVADVTAWESMIERSRQGLWAGIYIALLIFGLYHALNGLRGIILEMTPSARISRVVTWIIVIVGVVAFVLGTYVPVILLSV